MNNVKKDAIWWSVIAALWIFCLGLGLSDDSLVGFKMMGMILVPIALYNVAKKWLMVKQGWE